MLVRKFDPNQPYTVVLYVRMSDKKQNERSPDQQIAEIKRTIKRLKLNWKIKVVYRDDGVKGALIRKRPQFWRMLTDIYSGAVEVDLVLVDTTERFARAKELNSIREKLWEEYGVLLLTAENSFASPLTPEGKIYAAVEAMRATEENRVKAHQVLRAKRDIINLGRWPGGKPPRGLVLKKIIETVNGSDKFVGSEVVNDSRKINVDIIKESFRVCRKTGKRGSALATHLKALPQFKAEFQDLTGDTVDNWLKNTLYKGTLTWGLNCTGIVNDVRRLERNDPDDVIVKEDFCEAIIGEDEWNEVNLGRLPSDNAGGNNGTAKLLTPLAPGFKIKYMLSGLARCGCCSGSMTPVANKSKAGVSYVYYRCQRTSDNNCENRAYIHEPWLREQVIGYITSQVLGLPTPPDVSTSNDDCSSNGPDFEAFSEELTDEMSSLVEEYLEKQSSAENDSRPAIATQITEIDDQIRGWTQTLGNPSLPHEVRRSIEAEFDIAIATKADLEESLAQLDYAFAARSFRLDSTTVLQKMSRLSDVLAESNPSLVNIELSLHIDKIICNPDGTVTVRFCKLGLAGMEVVNSIGLVEVNNNSVTDDGGGADRYTCTPRRRARLSASSSLYSTWDLESLAHWATDPHRFEYMDDCWFEEVTFVRPEQLSWAEENAIDIAECRLNDRLTEAALAEKFGVCILTIRKGLKIASQLDSKYTGIPKKMPRARWHEDHAAEVLAASQNMMMKEMVAHFQKSDVTLRKAIKYAREELGLA